MSMRHLRCLLGRHKWSAWQATDYIGSFGCPQKRICELCGDWEKASREHDWTEWNNEDSCNDSRYCTICGKEQQRLCHKWLDWVYKNKKKCEAFRKCQRCGEIENEIKHEWRVIERATSAYCELRICKRCGERSVTSHSMVEDGYTGGPLSGTQNVYETTATCQNCGYVEGGHYGALD